MEHQSNGDQGERRGLIWDKVGNIYGDVEVSAVVRAHHPGLSKFQLGIHMSGTDMDRTKNTYYLDVFGSSSRVRINRYKNGSFNLLKSSDLSFSANENEWYNVVMQRAGKMLRAKTWPFGEEEPNAWQVSIEDQFINQGKVGFLHLTDGVTNDWAFFGVGTGGEMAPRPPKDLFNSKGSEVNKKFLQERINEIGEESLIESNYTASSWQALASARSKAQSVLENEEATQEAVDEALLALTVARDELVEKMPSTSETEVENKNDDQTNKLTAKETAGKGNKLPATAVPYYNWIVIGVAFLILATVLWAIHRRNKWQ